MRRAAVLLALVLACRKTNVEKSEAPPPEPPPPPAARPDVLVAKDLDLKTRVELFMKSPARGAEMITAVDAGARAYIDHRTQDFGVKEVSNPVFEKDASCTFSALERDGRTIMVRVDCRGLDGIPPTKELQWSSERGLAALRADVARELGAPPPAKTAPGPLADDVELLTSPLGGLRFGYGCGDDGQPTPGGNAVKRIVAAGRVDLLRAIARSPSPEGRLFALDQLAKLPEGLSSDDRVLREKVMKLPGTVRTCDGCIYGQKTAAKALARVPE